MGWCFGNGFGWSGFSLGGAILGGLQVMFLFGLLVVLAVWAIRALSRPHGGHSSSAGPSNDPALAILQERYARGEIDRDTYDRMRRDLSV